MDTNQRPWVWDGDYKGKKGEGEMRVGGGEEEEGLKNQHVQAEM